MADNNDFLRLIEQIPVGEVATYGMIANWAGSPGGGMAVGNALRTHSQAPGWHRVVNGQGSRGSLSSSAPVNQGLLLENDGIAFAPGGQIDLERFAWHGPSTNLASNVNVIDQRFADLPPADLLALYSDVMEEIKRRGISRGNNHPQADWAEQLVAKALRAEVQSQSNAGYDLLGPNGEKYEVKSRRVTGKSGERQLSAIRNLEMKRFDFLVGVLFGIDYRVLRAAIIPHAIVRDNCRYSDHTKSSVFQLTDGVWDIPGVVDLNLNENKTPERIVCDTYIRMPLGAMRDERAEAWAGREIDPAGRQVILVNRPEHAKELQEPLYQFWQGLTDDFKEFSVEGDLWSLVYTFAPPDYLYYGPTRNWSWLLDKYGRDRGAENELRAELTRSIYESVFACTRAERFCEGSLKENAEGMVRLCNEMRRRILGLN
jgi:alkylated DNA nucleotide flippase Atl1